MVVTFKSESRISVSNLAITTCPAVPATIKVPDNGHKRIFLTARRGSSEYGSNTPVFRNGGHSSSASSGDAAASSGILYSH